MKRLDEAVARLTWLSKEVMRIAVNLRKAKDAGKGRGQLLLFRGSGGGGGRVSGDENVDSLGDLIKSVGVMNLPDEGD